MTPISRELLEYLWSFSRELREESMELHTKVQATIERAFAVRDEVDRRRVLRPDATDRVPLTKA